MTVVRIPEIQTSMTENELAALAELAEGKTVLEIGSFLGASTITMAQSAKRVFAVDWHRGDVHHAPGTETLDDFLKSIREWDLRHKIIPVIGRTEHVLPVLREWAFDFVFVDAKHTYDAVLHDGGYALRLGDVVAFHDYGDIHIGVPKALEELGVVPDRIVDTLAICETNKEA